MTNIKIVQLLPMPNDATYQGVMFGLVQDFRILCNDFIYDEDEE